jgi:hypothetical protein
MATMARPPWLDGTKIPRQAWAMFTFQDELIDSEATSRIQG